MPAPRFWAARPQAAAVAAEALDGGSGDVIAGPPQAGAGSPACEPAGAARAELAQLFAARDADFTRDAEDDPDQQATQPMFLGTEPARL
jgi:hypothetical protein